VKLRKDIPGQ